MRVSEDRYIRDLRRIQLAQHLIRHEVRTTTIRLWTGLTEERVRNLARSYAVALAPTRRHRGPAPRRIVDFFRQTPLRSEASAFTAMACLYGIVPPRRLANARRDLPSVSAGERLCQAYALYRQVIRDARLSLEQSMLLVVALAEGTEARLSHCSQCNGALLIDPQALTREICFWCKLHEVRAEAADSAPGVMWQDESVDDSSAAGSGRQQRLF